MGGKSPVVASDEQRVALSALAGSRDRGEAEPYRSATVTPRPAGSPLERNRVETQAALAGSRGARPGCRPTAARDRRPTMSCGIGPRIWRGMSAVAAGFSAGGAPAAAAARWIPAMISATCASVVGTGQPARKCRERLAARHSCDGADGHARTALGGGQAITSSARAGRRGRVWPSHQARTPARSARRVLSAFARRALA